MMCGKMFIKLLLYA